MTTTLETDVIGLAAVIPLAARDRLGSGHLVGAAGFDRNFPGGERLLGETF